MPLDDNEFDLVISLATLHNLKVYDLKKGSRRDSVLYHEWGYSGDYSFIYFE